MQPIFPRQCFQPASLSLGEAVPIELLLQLVLHGLAINQAARQPPALPNNVPIARPLVRRLAEGVGGGVGHAVQLRRRRGILGGLEGIAGRPPFIMNHQKRGAGSIGPLVTFPRGNSTTRSVPQPSRRPFFYL
jgi:hypothetical protein